MVFLVSKDQSDLLPKEYYFMRLRYVDSVAKKVKIADRIYNLRTLDIYDTGYIRRKVEETRKYILPLCGDIGSSSGKLLMEGELERLEAMCREREVAENVQKDRLG